MHKKSKTVAAAKTVGKKAKSALRFLHKPNCTSCRKARGLLEKRGVELDLRDLGKDRLTTEELDQLIGDRDYRKFLNTRNEVYRQRKMAQNPPTRSEALRLMATEPNLIRRPVVICGDQIVLGFDAEALSKIVG
ncbi:MAG TPA: ArsC/Spx/MgsR family protein [Candidatus Acidoferrales bacterium]|jgi:Spx/MgsR family transcriptional regulator